MVPREMVGIDCLWRQLLACTLGSTWYWSR